MNSATANLIPLLIRSVLPGFALAALAACGGGSGGSGNGGGGNPPPANAVSGTVTGLTGSGLVLENNGVDDLVVTAVGPFFFTTALVAGQPYDVTVQSQPSAPAQHCTVANGSGTAGTDNPSNVTVSCTASTGYTVGGTVTGLTGSGLMLDVVVSGAQPLASVPVSATGTFTFPIEFGQGAMYIVAVGHQPASPTQLCVVTGGGGTVGTANVTDVSVQCASAGRFAYAANAGDDTISSYAIDPTTGALTAIGNPVATGASPYMIKGSPDGTHLYVVNQLSNDISAYAVNAATGALTPIPGSPFAAGTDPVALAFTPSGAYLYVTNKGSDSLAAYAVDAKSGALTPLAKPLYPTGPGPSDVLVDPLGKVVYVANGHSSSVSTFVITAQTGELTSVIGSPFSTGDIDAWPHSLVFEQGALLTGNSNPELPDWSISVMADFARTGTLTPNKRRTVPTVVNYMAASADDSGLFVATGDGLDVYWNFDWDLLPIASAPGASGANVYSVTVDPSNQFIYACNDGAANISGYTFTGGKFTAIPGSPFPAGHHPDFLAVL